MSAPVSVIVPCYRCTDTIERAVRSVATQTVRPHELILVDDASPDHTAEVLERLRERYGTDWIRILRLQENVGPGSARNAGWEAATQEYVAFLDSDDAWHPKKIEVQCAWMEMHGDVAVCGHEIVQLSSETQAPPEPCGGDARAISAAALYASNRITPSAAMLRRAIPERFEPRKRHMEDYLLWLEIALSGKRLVRLPQVLAFRFKAPFGETGLSARPWLMEKGELAAFSTMRRKGLVGAALWLLLCVFSLLKFVRRGFMLGAGYAPGGTQLSPPLLFAGSYLLLTQSMTALLVCAALLGRSELAADIGVAQAAAMATFFAFSGNARNLILTTRASVPIGTILATRLALLLPLGAAAVLLCAITGHVDLWLATILVARRAGEWIGELWLSECELLGRSSAARNSVLLQGTLLVAVLGVLAIAPDQAMWALSAWALLPLAPLVPFVGRGLRVSPSAVRGAISTLLPHYGSTAVTGISLYAFRAILVLVTGKPVAGDLFAAFAIGSFPGSLFANVLGPSVSLHEQRVGRAYLPRSLWAAMNAYLVGGLLLIAAATAFPSMLAWTGKSALFWLATGCSLLGGTVMVVAQRIRARLIADGQGDAVFGADLLTHLALLAAIPAVYAIGPREGLATLYTLNAVLALAFCATARGGALSALPPRLQRPTLALLVFLVFLPLFVQLTGSVFNPVRAWYDSGGLVRTLPVPVSVLACTLGVLLFRRDDADRPVLWAIFGLLLTMLVSTAVVGGASQSVDRNKMLTMLQILLPSFGLVIGAAFGREPGWEAALQGSILAVVAMVVPVQLATTWASGDFTLSYSLVAFGVYQHLQFVPVILVGAFMAVLPGLWQRATGVQQCLLAVLLALLATYAAAAHSVLAMLAMLVCAFCFATLAVWRKRPGLVLPSALILAALVGYNVIASESHAFRAKFAFLFSPDDPWVEVNEFYSGIRRRIGGGWEITGSPSPEPHARLMQIIPTGKAQRATLVVEGELRQGAIALFVEHGPRLAEVAGGRVGRPGPFRIEAEMVQDPLNDRILLLQEQPARGTITRLEWKIAGAAPSPARAAAEARIDNVRERFADWDLYQGGILESPKAFFFGHPAPLPREVRTSAHNFYIDLAYNFGAPALVPLALLLLYTSVLLWRRRESLRNSQPTVALAIVVLFLIMVESNLKVSLRQPYPGIAIYFLWGVLLSRLQALDHR